MGISFLEGQAPEFLVRLSLDLGPSLVVVADPDGVPFKAFLEHAFMGEEATDELDIGDLSALDSYLASTGAMEWALRPGQPTPSY